MAHKQMPVRRKHVPQRTCVVCRRAADKRTLTRLVCDPVEGIVVDPTGKRHGRGAYLCDADECWEQAMETDVLSRALRTRLTGADWQRLKDSRPS